MIKIKKYHYDPSYEWANKTLRKKAECPTQTDYSNFLHKMSIPSDF